VLRAPLEGGAPTVLADNQSGVLSLAVDARNVYWPSMSSGQVLGTPRAGGVEPLVIADKQNGPGAITVDDTGIYWTTDARGTRGAKAQRHDGALRVATK
jgi:hypothetical protein